MSDHFTVIAEAQFCDKLFRTCLFERDGLTPQIHVQIYQLDADSVVERLRSTLKLRPWPAREIAEAILRCCDDLEGNDTSSRVAS